MLDNTVASCVQAYISQHRDQILSELMELVRIPSVRGDASKEAPFGPGPAAALSFAANLFQKHGYTVEHYPESGYALAYAGTGTETLGVFCHCDTVDKNGRWNFTTPFEPIIRDGLLIGRGVKDNKSSVLSVLYALDAMKEAGVFLNHRIMVYLGSNEESGMADIDAFVREQEMPAFSLVPDCDYAVCRGEKSGYYFDTASQECLENVLAFTGSNVKGVVCRSAEVKLRAIPQLKTELLAAMQYHQSAELLEDSNGTLILKTEGISAHASIPMGTINGGAIATSILLHCPSLGEKDLRILRTAHQMLADYYGFYFGLAFPVGDFRPFTHVCSTIQVLEGHLCLSVQIRCSPVNPLAEVRERIERTLLADGWAFRETNRSLGFCLDWEDPVVLALNEVYTSLVKETSRGIYTSAACTYAHKLKNAVAIGIEAPITRIPQDFGRGHGGVHQPDECISVESFFYGIYVQAEMIKAMDERT